MIMSLPEIFWITASDSQRRRWYEERLRIMCPLHAELFNYVAEKYLQS
jgi:hypothetical protein